MLQRGGEKRRSDKGALMSVRLGCGAPGMLILSAARPLPPPSSGAGLRWPWGVAPSPARNSGHSVLLLSEAPHLGQAISMNLETSHERHTPRPCESRLPLLQRRLETNTRLRRRKHLLFLQGSRVSDSSSPALAQLWPSPAGHRCSRAFRTGPAPLPHHILVPGLPPPLRARAPRSRTSSGQAQ